MRERLVDKTRDVIGMRMGEHHLSDLLRLDPGRHGLVRMFSGSRPNFGWRLQHGLGIAESVRRRGRTSPQSSTTSIPTSSCPSHDRLRVRDEQIQP